MRTIVLDFETYYDKDYSLRKMSIPEYIHDARFHAHGMAVALDDEAPQWVPAEYIPEVLPQFAEDLIVMHNAYFDAAILKWRYQFSPKYMICTLQLANHVLGPAGKGRVGNNSLDSLATRLGLQAKGRLDFMAGVRNPSPADSAALQAYALNDVDLGRQVLNRLLPEVSRPEFELWLLDHTLRIYTDKVLRVDGRKVVDAAKLITSRRQEAVQLSGVEGSDLRSNAKFAAILRARLAAAKVKMPMKAGKNGKIPALAKADPAFLALAEHDNPDIANLVRARMIERSASTALARLDTLHTMRGIGGIPVHLVYYGAHTGRFSAGGGFNFQNLTNPDRAADDVSREIAATIRATIRPAEGKVFVADDAAQIEARVLAWLAGEAKALDAFAGGVDQYSAFISEVLREDIHKPTDADKALGPAHVTRLKLMRDIGKTAVLGLGFGMGSEKLLLQFRKQSRDISKMIDAGEIDAELATRIVDYYRKKHKKIVTFWYDLMRAFESATQGSTRTVGYLTLRKVGPRAVGIDLPSGRTLYYRDLRQVLESNRGGGSRKVWSYGNGLRIYGGMLAENVTQAVARDILAESILNVEQAGYPVALHVHDEIVCEVDEADGPKVLEFLDHSLSTPPEWAANRSLALPLAAEGRITKTLSK